MPVSISGVGSISGLDQGFNVTTGSIGIGTVSPASILHASGSSDQTVTIQTTTAGADSRINFRNSGGTDAGGIHYKHNGNHLTFLTGGSLAERLRITSAGNIGIGTDNPQSLLSLHQSGGGFEVNANSGSNNARLLSYDRPAGVYREMTFQALSYVFETGGTEKFRIKSDGYLGINQNSPLTRLDVKQNNGVAYNNRAQPVSYGAARFLNESGHTSGGTYTGFQFNITGDSQNRICSMGMITEASNTRNSSLVFHTDDNNNRTEKLRIKSGGEITSGNLSINAFANQNSPSGYAQFQFDNHYNTLFSQNLKLGASGGSGNHNIEIINQHGTIGGAGMYMGGNGSNQQNAINFYAEAANQSAGTDVTANRRAQIGSSAFFTWVEPRNLNSNGTSYLRTFGFTFNLQDGETETLFYNPDSYRRIWYEIYVQSGHGSNGYGYILANISRYGMLVHDVDWHVSYTSYAFSGSVGGNVSHNGIKFTRSGYANTNINYYVIVKAFSPAGGSPYSNSGLTDPSYRYFSQGY